MRKTSKISDSSIDPPEPFVISHFLTALPTYKQDQAIMTIRATKKKKRIICVVAVELAYNKQAVCKH